VSEAIRIYEKENPGKAIRVWGYRNIWYRYRIGETNVMVPVSLNSLSTLHTAFINCLRLTECSLVPEL